MEIRRPGLKNGRHFFKDRKKQKKLQNAEGWGKEKKEHSACNTKWAGL